MKEKTETVSSGPTVKRKTFEERLQEKHAQIAARLSVIASKRRADNLAKAERLSRIVGAACMADETLREVVRAAVARNVRSPHDREFLKIEGWI